METLIRPAVHRVLAFGLVPEILAGGIGRRAERAHVQQAADAVVAAGLGYLHRQLAMDAREVPPGTPMLVQYADEIDDGAASLHLHAEVGHRMHVGFHQLEIRNHDEIPAPLATPGEHAHRNLAPAQLGTEMAPDESGATEYAHCSNSHWLLQILSF
jgi:hypothetical protein